MNALRSGLLLLCGLAAAQAQAAFTVNADGTVSDSETGLVWDRCSWGLTGADCSGGLADSSFWGDALVNAIAANGSTYKGHTDWRMPNVKELESLLKIEAGSAPFIDTDAFPATTGLYATSNIAAGLLTHAHGVNFSTGQVQRFNGAFKTRLVRGGEAFDALATDFAITVTVSPPEAGTASCTPNPVSQLGSSTCTYLANQGYTFADWSGDCTGASCELSDVTSEKSVTANFTQDAVDYPITVTVNPPAGGTASCAPNPVSPSGSSTCTYTANQGYTFANWSGDCTGASCELSEVTSEKSVTANFTLDSGDFPITVTVSPPEGGTASCTPNPVGPSGSSTCTYTANQDYGFLSWSGDCTGASCELSEVTSPKSVTANFTLILDPPDPPPNGGQPQPVPALAGWALVLLSGLFVLGGWVTRRR